VLNHDKRGILRDCGRRLPVPNNPGPSAAVVAGMTAAVIDETTRLHREATQVYRTYHNVHQAIKKLIIKAFDDANLNALSDEIVNELHLGR
jgi:hypothetical protein